MPSREAAGWLWRRCFLCSLLYSCTVQLIAANARVWRHPWRALAAATPLAATSGLGAMLGCDQLPLPLRTFWVGILLGCASQAAPSQSEQQFCSIPEELGASHVLDLRHDACALVTSSAPATLSRVHTTRCACVCVPVRCFADAWLRKSSSPGVDASRQEACRVWGPCAVLQHCVLCQGARRPQLGVVAHTPRAFMSGERTVVQACVMPVGGGAVHCAACDLQRHRRGWSCGVQTVANRDEWCQPLHPFEQCRQQPACCAG